AAADWAGGGGAGRGAGRASGAAGSDSGPGRSRELDDLPVASPLGVSDALVGEERDVALDGPDVDEAHGFLVAGPAEEALAGPEHDREDLQPQLIDQVVLHQHVYQLQHV